MMTVLSVYVGPSSLGTSVRNQLEMFALPTRAKTGADAFPRMMTTGSNAYAKRALKETCARRRSMSVTLILA